VRAWDFAATVPSESNRDPDYTAGVKISRDKMGIYYVEDAYRFRKLTDGVLKEVISTAKADGLDDCVVGIVRDGGAGGAAANMFFVRQLAEQGIAARSTKMSGHSGKVQRFLPFAAMAEAGCVKIVRGPWNDTFLNELESFTGGRSGHDDQVDATSDAFNMIAKSIQLPTFVLPNFTKPSISNQLSVD
jgi:predicted phage terminase large subunit-like protein